MRHRPWWRMATMVWSSSRVAALRWANRALWMESTTQSGSPEQLVRDSSRRSTPNCSPAGVKGLGDAVGIEDDRVVGLELQGLRGRVERVQDAQGERGGVLNGADPAREAILEARGVVTGVGVRESTRGGVEDGEEGGHEAALEARGEQAVVGELHDLSGVEGVLAGVERGVAVHDGVEHGHDGGRGCAVAADVGDEDGPLLAREAEEVVVVPAGFVAREVAGGELKAGDVQRGRREGRSDCCTRASWSSWSQRRLLRLLTVEMASILRLATPRRLAVRWAWATSRGRKPSALRLKPKVHSATVSLPS